MMAFILSVLSSTLIFLIFNYFKRFNINVLHAIIVNYFTAFVIGVVLFSREWTSAILDDKSWVIFVLIVSIMLIGLFVIMGRSTQVNGVASTSVAVKMSMAGSLVLLILFYHEQVSILKVLGILMAVIGVFLVSHQPRAVDKGGSWWMLPFLFAGSGLLDFTLNFVQDRVLTDLSPSLFTAFSFFCAGLLGFLLLLVQRFRGKLEFAWKNVIAGIILGVPNYFSIYFLLLSYRTTGWEDSTVLALTNVCVVLASSFFGFLLFREHINRRKLLGLLAAIFAIIILYFAA